MASEARRSFLSFRNRSSTKSTDENTKEPLKVQLPGLWKAMIITSFAINLVLIFIILFLVGFLIQHRNSLFGLTGNIAGNVQELQDVVVQLQEADIIATIPLDQQLPIHLIVPIDTTTTVVTTAPVPISAPADIDLGPFGRLNPNVNLALPPGTSLDISLKLDVPLDTSIPVQLDVPVHIPLKETELAPQFQRLGAVLNRLLSSIGPLIGVDIPESPPIQLPSE